MSGQRALFYLIGSLWLGAIAWPQATERPRVLHPCDDLQGWTVNVGRNYPETKLEINADARFISEGKGSLHAATISPREAPGNTYLSLVLTTPPINMEGQALQFEAATSDPQITQALYVRGYDAQGRTVLSWMSWAGPLKGQLTTFELIPGLSLGALQWEPGVLQSDDRRAIVRWEFYVGTHEKGAPFDLYLDNVRLIRSEVKSFMDIQEARPLYRETPLLENGTLQCVLMVPTEQAWAPVTQALVEGLTQALGQQPAVIAGDTPEALAPPQKPAIVLGNVGNNRGLLYLYAHYMTAADALFPGPGGYELRTISNPWGGRVNAIVIGASDPAGGQAGVAAFLEAVKKAAAAPQHDKILLPRLCEIKPAPDVRRRIGAFEATLDEKWLAEQQQRAQQALASGAHTGLFSMMASVGESYIATGRDEYARLFVWLARQAKQWHDSKPKTYGGPWGMDADFPGHRVMPMWAMIEQSPALTEADRRDVSRILFEYVQEAALPEALGAANAARVGRSVSNHGTFAALATFLAGEYYSKYYDAAEGKQWLKIGDDCFTNLAQHFKAHEDCNGYQWLTNVHILRYALTKPDFTVFENGHARQMADYAIATMNNLGYQVPYGDTGEWSCWFSELPLLRMAEYFYREGKYRWAVEKKLALRNSRPLWEYDTAGPATEPEALKRFTVVPLDERWYRSMGGEGSGVPLAKAFDKIAFRESFDPAAAYLLLDGLSNGGHRHQDGNAILQWTENERVWLADADYIKAQPKYHNSVLILREGQSASLPDFVELEHAADLPSGAVSVTTYRQYAGVDWRRHVIWIKGRMFVVVDQMFAREAGDYSFRTIWQTIGNVRPSGSGIDIEQGGQWARFVTTADARLRLYDDPVTGKNWGSYPYAGKPIVHVMQGVYNKRLVAGETFSIFTVLHASGGKPSEAQIKRVGENLAVVTGVGEPLLVGVPDAQGEITLFGEGRGKMAGVVFTPEKALAIAVHEAAFLGQQERFPEGADIEIDLKSGEALIKKPAGVVAQARPTIERRRIQLAVSPEEIRSFLQMAVRAASPSAPAAPHAAFQAPTLKALWTYAQRLDSYLLTNNANAFEAVDAGLRLSCNPPPLPQNVFANDKTNTLDNLTDGELLTTDGGVMWDDDQIVTIDAAFDNEYELQRLVLRAWFATSSSKGKRFQLGRLQVLGSTDGFKRDRRVLADFTDTAEHPNWGLPAHVPEKYELALTGKARQLRLVLTPRPGTAIYLAELQIWGWRPGLEIDLRRKQAAGLPAPRFAALTWADINGDGQAELLAGSSEGSVICFSAEGRRLWKADAGAPVNVLATVDFAGDGRPTIVAGCMNSRLVAIDGTGKERWVFTPPYYKEPAHFRVVFPADLEGQGRQVVIGGADNWHFYAVNGEGKELWRYESVHGSTAGAAADLDGDKRDEIIAGTEYYWWHVINPDGTRRFSYSVSTPSANAATAGDLNGDGQPEVLFGGADAQVHCLNASGERRWLFHTGDEVTALRTADVNGDGKAELLVGSLSFNVYCLDGAGKILWRQDLGSPVLALTLWPQGAQQAVAVGLEEGGIVILAAATGRVLYHYATPGAIGQLAASPGRLAASTSDGNLLVLGAP